VFASIVLAWAHDTRGGRYGLQPMCEAGVANATIVERLG
jgi:hypothetical protein